MRNRITNAAFRVFLFVILSAARLFAQPTAADSIRQRINALDPRDPEYLDEKIGNLGTLFMTIVNADPKEALRVNAELVECLKLKGDSVAYVEAAYRHKAIAYGQLGDYTKNVSYLEAYAEALNRLGHNDGYAYVDLGNAYFAYGLFDLARDSYREADEVFERTGNAAGRCTVHNNYAQIFFSRRQYDSAMVELRHTLRLRQEQLHDDIIAGDSKLLIGVCFREMKQNDSAKYYFRQVIRTFNDPALRQHRDHVALQEEYSGAYNFMASVFINEQNWDSAAWYLGEGKKMYELYGYERRINASYTTFARLYLGRNMPDSALAYIRRIDANDYSHLNPDMRMRLYDLYADYYKATGNLQEYYRYKMLYYQESDSSRSQSLNEGSLMAGSVMREMKNKARIERQEAELARKDAEVARQKKEKLMLYALSGLLLIVIAGGFFFFFQIRNKNRLIGRYNSELEEANATKEKFLSVISHDLRNPFNTLIGMSNVLVTNVKEHKLAQVIASAEAINESSRKAYVLLDNLMQWVSLQKEKIRVRKEPVMLNEAVEEVLRLFRNQALAQSITISKDIRTPVISSDRNLLQVVLRNLLSNAIRHIPVGGAVRICAETAGDDVRLSVEDNGRGIDPQTLATLFTKKDHATIARKGGGLGLVLVQEFVEQMGGSISVENIPGSGARFTIVLKNAAMEKDVHETGAAEAAGMLTLTTEDRQRLSELVSRLEQYEIFDTTELRKLIENFSADGSAAVQEWLSRIRQAVYHADDEKFRRLLHLVKQV